ncbi:MAG: universal stress protein [Myxococcota bacterium]
MRRILVLAPHEDRAERSLTLAGQLAQRTGASLTLLRVLEESVGGDASLDTQVKGCTVRELLLATETSRMEEVAERMRASQLEVAVEVRWGVAWELVLDLVERDGFDLVIKPASGWSHEGAVFFGSTALHLFRRCPCPVWIVGDDGRLPASIMAAVDPTRTPRPRASADRILGWAERVRDWADANLEVVSAWHAAGGELLQESLDEAELKDYVETTRGRVQADLDDLLAQDAHRGIAGQLVEGPAEEVLPRVANDRDVDLIVMGTRGRQDRVGDLLGETAETIIRQVRSSILTIPPDTE